MSWGRRHLNIGQLQQFVINIVDTSKNLYSSFSHYMDSKGASSLIQTAMRFPAAGKSRERRQINADYCQLESFHDFACDKISPSCDEQPRRRPGCRRRRELPKYCFIRRFTARNRKLRRGGIPKCPVGRGRNRGGNVMQRIVFHGFDVTVSKSNIGRT